MINPFVVEKLDQTIRLTIPHIEALVNWIYKYAETSTPTKVEIAKNLLSFIKKVDQLLEGQHFVMR
jgi:hypothetical protein